MIGDPHAAHPAATDLIDEPKSAGDDLAFGSSLRGHSGQANTRGAVKSRGAYDDAMNLAFPEPTSSRLLARVRPRYDESHRRYHTWTHIEACFAARAELTREASPTIDLALLFHDAIYDPLAHDNEEKSAELLLEEGRREGIDEDTLTRSAPLVLATKHGAITAASEEARIVVDADLSILGTSRDVFDAYERAVREEYAMIEDAMFTAGRTRVLQEFLNRKTIFETPRGRELWEARARENISRSLASLEALVTARGRDVR